MTTAEQIAEATEIKAGLVIHKGDKVLLAVEGARLTPQAAAVIKERLGDRFPDVEFTIVEGAALLKLEVGS